jgi:hypothetical protein
MAELNPEEPSYRPAAFATNRVSSFVTSAARYLQDEDAGTKFTEGLKIDNVTRASCSRYIFFLSKYNFVHHLYVILEKVPITSGGHERKPLP